MKQIPFFDYKRLYLDKKTQFLETIDKVASKGGFIMQKELEQFERNISSFCCSKYALGVGNATDALELAWHYQGLKKNDEIIISSHTMLATASAIKLSGGTPIPVDIGEDGLIDPDEIEKAINKNTIGISPTHLNGRTCDMERIKKIADKNSLILIEDAAQALGSKFKGKHAGTFGSASCISFYPAKVLGCLGDGGVILIQDKSTYENIYKLRDHGRDKEGEVDCWGRNTRLDNIQAALLDLQLQSYSHVISRRREIAFKYNERLSSLSELILPPPPKLNDDHFDIFQNYEIQALNRNKLKDFLLQNGIGTLIQWNGKAVHQFNKLGFNQELPKTEKYFKRCIMLPINMFISNKDIDYISDKIISFYKNFN